MNESETRVAPRWLTIVAVICLIWNIFGLAVFAMAMTVFRSENALKDAGLNEQQIEVTLAAPTWVNVAFGVAVIFGVLGCLALVMKKKVAVPLLVVSLVGVIAQNTYMYFLSDTVKVMGVGASPFVIVVAIGLVPFAIMCSRKGWLT